MTLFLLISLALLLVMALLTLVEVLRGPSMPDRLLAANMAVNILTFVLAVAGAIKGSDLYFDAALVAALLSFAAAIVIAKFISTGRVM